MNKYDLYSICSVLLLVVSLKQHPSKAQQPYVNDKQFNCEQDLNITNGFKMQRRQNQLPILPHVPIHSSLQFSTVHWPPLGRWFFLHRRNQQRHNLPGNPHRYQDHHPCRLFMFGCWVLPAQQLLQGAAVRQLFQHGQWHLPGLTTCQAIKRENPYTVETLGVGVKVKVPLRCACPTSNQTASGFKYLLAYITTSGENISTIADLFGADKQSILDANELSEDSIICPFTPLVVPLKSKPTGIVKSVILGNHSCQFQPLLLSLI